ncbi:hypothetical protein AHMF7605_17665 [Adhaeribacter arboris]|uniref:DUF5683 domain-containing protein n=1 Tax=Adhaeribacter arboris TaxID=2072846 RepID=A0A2T2YI62_9BACT|nr:hypothetical protein [Adhaeribacter arboris]PSR55203.1 hypothetical protein AHMF7605_17665 [Adhaeribacter arboris]
MKKYLLLLLLGLFSPFSWGQIAPTDIQEPGLFIGLNNGQRVYARKLQIKSPLFKKTFVLINDSAQYDMSNVQYFQDEEGFYTRISNNKRSDFAKRVSVGKISKFYTSKTSYDNYYPGMYGYGYGGYGYGMPSTRQVYYFSKDGGPLADMNYQNLRQALNDNPGSLEVLEKYRRSKRVETGLTVAGSGIFIYGLINSLKAPATGVVQRADPTLYLGLGLAAIPWAMHFFRKDHLNEAIELYNYDLAQQPPASR